MGSAILSLSLSLFAYVFVSGSRELRSKHDVVFWSGDPTPIAFKQSKRVHSKKQLDVAVLWNQRGGEGGA
ncbi:unnamed protein product [Prunus brigantina]